MTVTAGRTSTAAVVARRTSTAAVGRSETDVKHPAEHLYPSLALYPTSGG